MNWHLKLACHYLLYQKTTYENCVIWENGTCSNCQIGIPFLVFWLKTIFNVNAQTNWLNWLDPKFFNQHNSTKTIQHNKHPIDQIHQINFIIQLNHAIKDLKISTTWNWPPLPKRWKKLFKNPQNTIICTKTFYLPLRHKHIPLEPLISKDYCRRLKNYMRTKNGYMQKKNKQTKKMGRKLTYYIKNN